MVVSSHVKLKTHMGPQQPVQPCVLQVSFRDLSEISRGGGGGVGILNLDVEMR